MICIHPLKIEKMGAASDDCEMEKSASRWRADVNLCRPFVFWKTTDLKTSARPLLETDMDLCLLRSAKLLRPTSEPLELLHPIVADETSDETADRPRRPLASAVASIPASFDRRCSGSPCCHRFQRPLDSGFFSALVDFRYSFSGFLFSFPFSRSDLLPSDDCCTVEEGGDQHQVIHNHETN
ncbi:hypothetical protein LXL04_032572 [Taraxacum kok-saghyz]